MAHTPSSPVCFLQETQDSLKYSSESANLNQTSTMSSEETLHDLITANHILHHHNVLDAYGHISVRNPTNPSRFFLSYSLAPALISSASDLVEYHISDASPVNSTAKGYSERFIHSEILKQYPNVKSVVHSHSEAVLPYTVSGVPLQAAFHIAGFLGLHSPIHRQQPVNKTQGTNVPIFDTAAHTQRNSRLDLLVSTPLRGAAFADSFSKQDSYTARLGHAATSLVSSLAKSSLASDESPQPDHTVVLMRGHGFTTVGSSIQEAVFRAIYTQQNAAVQTTALLTRNAHLNAEDRGKKPEEKTSVPDTGPHYLSEQEISGCTLMGAETAERPWGLWVREVESSPLYVHEQ